MSRKDAILLASRTLALLLTVWVLSDISGLPESVHSFFHYMREVPRSSTNIDYLEYLRHYYLIRLAFLVIRIVGFTLLARWIYKGGAEVEELFLPSTPDENPAQS